VGDGRSIRPRHMHKFFVCFLVFLPAFPSPLPLGPFLQPPCQNRFIPSFCSALERNPTRCTQRRCLPSARQKIPSSSRILIHSLPSMTQLFQRAASRRRSWSIILEDCEEALGSILTNGMSQLLTSFCFCFCFIFISFCRPSDPTLRILFCCWSH